ncbi:hypothetical protein CVT24_013019 [Panaeolus cyanescens]|uniref:Uncharacterized protein n=1 Tax=Panaeolus cyanescens TaxID=181874 RepID=A0A409X8J1_9AGAR|nr:hypothetical protein CVT24_013019 [Panaeolus cyanescens]
MEVVEEIDMPGEARDQCLLNLACTATVLVHARSHLTVTRILVDTRGLPFGRDFRAAQVHHKFSPPALFASGRHRHDIRNCRAKEIHGLPPPREWRAPFDSSTEGHHSATTSSPLDGAQAHSTTNATVVRGVVLSPMELRNALEHRKSTNSSPYHVDSW